MANIKQVAEYAGLSPSCVSKYLRNPNSVRDSSRQRIEKAIRDLKYIPSPIARSLRNRKTNYIMIIQRSVLSPFYYTLFDRLRLDLEAHGYTAILQITENELPPQSAFLQVDGVIMVLQDRQAACQIYSSIPDNTPVVFYSPEKVLADVPTVMIDLQRTTHEMCQYLYDQGCRTFAYIGRSLFDEATKRRLPAFREYFADKPGSYRPEDILLGSSSYDNDFQTGSRLAQKLAAQPELPDAIFCENDYIAVGCSVGLMSLGINYADKVIISGADNIPLVEDFTPPIVTQDYNVLPSLLCQELYHLIDGVNASDHVLHPSIIDRRIGKS